MLKKGDKVKCVYNTFFDHLTLNKEYEIIEQVNDIVYIRNDVNRYSSYHVNRFKSLREIRKEKILKIERNKTECEKIDI